MLGECKELVLVAALNALTSIGLEVMILGADEKGSILYGDTSFARLTEAPWKS
jgi:hypothetical protein